MKSVVTTLLVLLFCSVASATDFMVVCYSFTPSDACSSNPNQRKLLAKQGTPNAHNQRSLSNCGSFCNDWSTFCAEYDCGGEKIYKSCEGKMEDARNHFKKLAHEVGSEECVAQMSDEQLKCMCVDQDKGP